MTEPQTIHFMHPDLLDVDVAPPPAAYVALGFILGLVALGGLAIAAANRRRRRDEVISLPDYEVWRHCPCGYPSRDRKDLALHLTELHPHLSPEERFDIIFPTSSQGSE
jgi:hypothetical protein